MESKENEISEEEIIDAKTTKPNFSREKKHYSHHKEPENLNSVIQELKEANERIVELTEEQVEMNKKIKEQQNIIIKIHQFMKVIVDKMGTMQPEQENNSRKKSRSIADYEIHNFKKENFIKSKQEREKCNQQLQLLKDMLNDPPSHSLSHPPKQAKEKEVQDSFSKNQTHQKKSVQKNSQMRDVIRTESEDELSDYLGEKYQTSQTQKNRNSKKGDKAQMLERLKELIEEKEKKKMELKLSGAKGYSKSKSKWNSVSDEENSAFDYENYDKEY